MGDTKLGWNNPKDVIRLDTSEQDELDKLLTEKVGSVEDSEKKPTSSEEDNESEQSGDSITDEESCYNDKLMLNPELNQKDFKNVDIDTKRLSKKLRTSNFRKDLGRHIPGKSIRHPDVDGTTKPNTQEEGVEWEDVKEYYNRDEAQVIDKDIERINKIGWVGMTKDSPLVHLFGCKNCWWRDTDDCPHGIKSPDVRKGWGYCQDKIKQDIAQHILTRSVTGMKHIRNVNMIKTENMMRYYRAKLQRLKEEGKVTKTEMYLLKKVMEMESNMAERIDRAIKQDEGTTIKTERKFTPSDLNKILARANEKEVEGEVID